MSDKSLYSLLKKCENLSGNLQVMKSNQYIKEFSQYLHGGVSKLKKQEIEDIINSFKLYEKFTNGPNFMFGKKIYNMTKEQQEIIDIPHNRTMRIIAGAGTAKTTTILLRIKS